MTTVTVTTKELLAEFNALAAERGLPELTGWRASKEALQTKIDELGTQTPDPLAIPSDTEAHEPVQPGLQFIHSVSL